MAYETVLTELAKVADSFLKANGGLGNGYATYVKGRVSTNGAYHAEWNTPSRDDLTGTEAKRRGRLLNTALAEILKKHNLTECKFSVEYGENSYGCGVTYVEIAERKRVEL